MWYEIYRKTIITFFFYRSFVSFKLKYSIAFYFSFRSIHSSTPFCAYEQSTYIVFLRRHCTDIFTFTIETKEFVILHKKLI